MTSATGPDSVSCVSNPRIARGTAKASTSPPPGSARCNATARARRCGPGRPLSAPSGTWPIPRPPGHHPSGRHAQSRVPGSLGRGLSLMPRHLPQPDAPSTGAERALQLVPNQRSNAMSDPITNVVLVHGGFVDGSGWSPLYGLLTQDGYHVAVVQNPTLSLQGDAAATRMIIDAQDGPCVLVGHSYGGAVLSEGGTGP